MVGVSPWAIVSMLQCSGTSEVLLEAIDSLLLESEMAPHNLLSWAGIHVLARARSE